MLKKQITPPFCPIHLEENRTEKDLCARPEPCITCIQEHVDNNTDPQERA